MRRIRPVIVAMLAALALIASVPTAAVADSDGLSDEQTIAQPTSTNLVIDDSCLASSYPDNLILCGYHQDGPWLFPSGRKVTAWGGFQLSPNGANARYWYKISAIGLSGTHVDVYARFRHVVFDCDGNHCGSTEPASACTGTSACDKVERSPVYWVGGWHAIGSLSLTESFVGDPTGGLIWPNTGIKVTIQNTNDTTSWHCVSPDDYHWGTGQHSAGSC